MIYVKTQDVEVAPFTNSLKDRKKTQDQTQTETNAKFAQHQSCSDKAKE